MRHGFPAIVGRCGCFYPIASFKSTMTISCSIDLRVSDKMHLPKMDIRVAIVSILQITRGVIAFYVTTYSIQFLNKRLANRAQQQLSDVRWTRFRLLDSKLHTVSQSEVLGELLLDWSQIAGLMHWNKQNILVKFRCKRTRINNVMTLDATTAQPYQMG